MRASNIAPKKCSYKPHQKTEDGSESLEALRGEVLASPTWQKNEGMAAKNELVGAREQDSRNLIT